MIWIIGNKGMLGSELSELFTESEIEFFVTDKEVDICDLHILQQKWEELQPDWIVNCSAYTAVDKAEEDRDAAFQLNHQGVENLARIASRNGVKLIHISTDYVFDGNSSEPLSEEAVTSPVSVYGLSKLAGEKAIQKHCASHYIIRTAWLYGKYGNNFVYTMISLMNSRDKIKVVSDQIGSPTWARDLSGLINTIISEPEDHYGIYHFSGAGQCSWYEFACEIYRLARRNNLISSDCEIVPCGSDEFPTAARRPAFSLLSKEKIRQVFHYSPQEWKSSLANFLSIIDKKQESRI